MAYRMKSILILDAFHRGSHAAWSKGLAASLPLHGWKVELKTLPGRHWKWRMHGAALTFATQAIKEGWSRPDVILATDMLDITRLRGSLPKNWRSVPIAAYFHENQIGFPVNDPDFQNEQVGYGFANVQSAWAADAVWFNSQHHLEEMLNGIPELFRRLPESAPSELQEQIRGRAQVIYPGLDLPAISPDRIQRPCNERPIIVWNHRWEYDKNPSFFCEVLQILHSRGIPFEVDLLGVGDRKGTSPLSQLMESDWCTIINEQPAQNAEAYWDRLQQGDVLVHSPLQEYFGFSAVEALHAGVLPVLPNQHAYPEYAQGFESAQTPEQAAKLIESIRKAPQSAVEAWRYQAHQAVQRFQWDEQVKVYSEALTAVSGLL